ncbi:MAG: hypothetical protein AAFV77_03225 [Planctomycetota bacterium]
MGIAVASCVVYLLSGGKACQLRNASGPSGAGGPLVVTICFSLTAISVVVAGVDLWRKTFPLPRFGAQLLPAGKISGDLPRAPAALANDLLG